MADAFGDELFSVFEDDSTTAAGTKKDKEKGKWKGPPGSSEKAGKCVDVKLQSESTNSGKKRDADFESTDEPIYGKKIRIEESITEDLSLADLMPRVKVQAVETVEGCTHEVALPADEDYLPLKPRVGKAAKEYPFILDAFQREAIQCVDNNQSVLVSAHTSAGKTVCAEYAIALALREKQRVIFTSPIKALSNQKYREMYEEFQDVGLMTGDVTINPTASCLVMTTEILRSMLYRGSEVMREVAWVIFDEIHYMRDSERGVVWEETIILLPDNVHYVFLSATIPNARQFAEWICHLHKQPCHVIYTDYRPTPLQHYIFPAGGDGLHLVVDENGDFREDNFNTAMQVLRDAGDLAKGDQKGRKGGTKGPSNVFKIVKMIMERNFQPVIIFSFSKKDCEAYALQMTKLDFNTDEEKKMVEEVFSNAIDCLSDEDKKLPQVEHVLPLLKRGIGIHHGGLLPILKETIEILFSEGLIKALFATETFAMGINMPARTVLFTNARKFDGKDFRWISSGEYIQMSGRAGRRGMDDRGIVILMVDEKMSPTIGKQLLKVTKLRFCPFTKNFRNTLQEPLQNQFLREERMYLGCDLCKVYNFLRLYIYLFTEVKKSEEQYNKIVIPNEESVVIYYKIRQQLAKLGKEIEEYIHKPKYCLPFLQPGRLVKVKNEGDDFGWGVVVNFSKKSNVKPNSGELDPLYVVEVLLRCSKESLKNSATEAAKPAKPDEKGEMQVVPVLVHLLTAISSVRLYIPKDLRPVDNRQSVLKSIQIETDIKSAKRELKKARTVLQMDELKCRKRVLRRLGFATSSDVIEMKGRVACEISSADELLLTEMMFNGLFNDLSAEQATALLSCFVFQENSSEMPKLTEQLAGPLRQMQECAKRIAKVSAEAKLEIDEETYLSSFKPHLMDVVYTWATGATFAHICKMTDVFEGSIIRCMRRLEELLRQMCQAAKAIGNTELENKFAEGITKIKRDIVFAASLYL
ncbi:exosome RNA helicase MTR4 [Trichechus manatus latirostris]|uniref:Exosome RNA helicase MTR4 n=1 Tax=Trichechus manatus latirostris TaxID=127582 RepID=A0A2Y9R5H4_TRIMA|nr:exosome RNA helicase MTR4 [Trichechus manatus latirostris]